MKRLEEVQEDGDLKIRRCRESKIRRFLNLKDQGDHEILKDSTFKGPKIQGLEEPKVRDVKIQRYRDTKVEKFRDPSILKFKDLISPRFKDSKVQKPKDWKI